MELLPPAPELGLGGEPIWGVSVLSGRPLSVTTAARYHPLVALVGKIGRLRPEDTRDAVAPALALAEVKQRSGPLSAMFARIIALLPGFAARFCVRSLGTNGGINGLRDILSPAPLVLAGADPKIRVRERLNITLGAEPAWQGDGAISVSMEVHGRSTAATIARYGKAFGPNWGVSGGFLLLRQRLSLSWLDSSTSPRFIRAIGRNTLALSDLSAHPAISRLAAPDAVKTVAPTLAMQIDTAYMPEASADDAEVLRNLLTLAASIPSEEGYRGLSIAVTLNPKTVELPIGEFILSTTDIILPHAYPPVQSCELWLTGLNRAARRIQRVETIVSSEGASARLKVLEHVAFEASCTLSIQMTFRHDAGAVRQDADMAQLRIGFIYRYPLAGIRDVSLLPVSGHRGDKSVQTVGLTSSYDLAAHVSAEVSLGKLLFPSSLRRPLTINAGSRVVDMGFMRELASLLADEGIEVRSILESQAGAYSDGSFLCDLHGRYEKSMAGPDVHIRVLRSREGGADRPSTRFELTVLGRAEGEAERAPIEAVNQSICEVLTGIAAGTDPPGAIPSSMQNGAGAVKHTDPPTDDTFGRMEALISQLAQLVGDLRRQEIGGSHE